MHSIINESLVFCRSGNKHWNYLQGYSNLNGRQFLANDDFSPSTAQRDPNHDWACVGVASGFRCGFCGMSLLCIGGNAYMQPCPPDTSCTHRPEFSGAVCHTAIPSDCQCRRLNELLPDPYNPASFIVCTSFRGISPRSIEMCPTGYFFNTTTSTCQKIPTFPSCVRIGTFPYTDDCHWYYTCSIGPSGNWVQMPAKCMTSGHVYSSTRNGCADPSALPSTDQCSSNRETPRSQYICTWLGLIVASLFPSYVDTFCHKI